MAALPASGIHTASQAGSIVEIVARAVRDQGNEIHDLVVVDLNERALALFGEGHADAIRGLCVKSIVDPNLAKILIGVARNGTNAEVDGVLIAGTRRVHLYGRASRTDPDEVALAAIDVTERDARRARAAVEDRLGGLARVVMGVSHEFNNPLTWIGATLEQLRASLVERQRDRDLESLDAALSGVARLTRVIGEIRSADPTGDHTVISVSQAIESAIAIARPSLGCVRVACSIGADLPHVRGDRRLAHAIVGILRNAAEAAPTTISVSATRSAGHVQVVIGDDGFGMEDAVVRHAFEPFFTTRTGTGATGLGLWIVRSLIDAFGGTIALRSTLGVGTEVELLLPALVASAADPVRRTESGSPDPGPLAPEQPAPQATNARLRVLVVDDEPHVANTLRRLLSKSHDVVVEHRAAPALERIASGERFDVVLTDLIMPEMDGIEFFVTAETLDEELARRFIVITGGASPEVMAGIRARGLPLIEKPFDAATIRDTIGTLQARDNA